MPTLYIIAGCNGAGKSTTSYTILPEILDCKEFVNADNIAAGISPFQPESVTFEAGRLMLQRINILAKKKVNFAIETTLSSKHYIKIIEELKLRGYEIVVIFFWLKNPELAVKRVGERVKKGGHYIEREIVFRRYYRGLKNLLKYFIPLSNYWLIIDNSSASPNMIAEGINSVEIEIFNSDIWTTIEAFKND